MPTSHRTPSPCASAPTSPWSCDTVSDPEEDVMKRSMQWVVWVMTLALAVLAGCAAPMHSAGLSDVIERPAERALLTGMRAYDDAQYAQAERALNTALHSGLASPKDRASAHKLHAFIYC